MCSIEKITSKTTKIKYPDANKPNGYGEKEVKMYMPFFLSHSFSH